MEGQLETKRLSLVPENVSVKSSSDVEPDFTPKAKRKNALQEKVVNSLDSPLTSKVNAVSHRKSPFLDSEVGLTSEKIKTASGKKSKKSKGGKTPKENGSVGLSGVSRQRNTWPEEDEYLLVDTLVESLKPNDVLPYSKSMAKIDWQKLSINNHSPESCKEKLMELVGPLIKVKSLTMLLQEAREDVANTDKRSKSIASAKELFKLNFYEKYRGKLSANELRSQCTAAWSKLPLKERRIFELEHQKEVDEYRQIRDCPPFAPTKSPFQLFYETQCAKLNTSGMAFRSKCMNVFAELELEEKSRYIALCVKEWAKYKKEYDVYKSKHPDADVELAKITSRQSIFQPYLEYLGMPERPTGNVFKCLRTDLEKKGKLDPSIEPKDILRFLTNTYKTLSQEERDRYKDVMRKSKLAFDQKWTKWKSQIDEDTRIFVESYFEKQKVVVDKAKTKGKASIEFENVQTMAIAKPKFADEPLKPPATPYKIFSLKFEKKRKGKYQSVKEMKDACLNAWNSMSGEEKDQYKKRWQEYIAAYKEEILRYVKELGATAGIYIGFSRKPLSQLFKEDILENDYPNAEYPVYVVGKKKVVTPKKLAKLDEYKLSGSSNDEKAAKKGILLETEERYASPWHKPKVSFIYCSSLICTDA